jgi:hypothetical protein
MILSKYLQSLLKKTIGEGIFGARPKIDVHSSIKLIWNTISSHK